MARKRPRPTMTAEEFNRRDQNRQAVKLKAEASAQIWCAMDDAFRVSRLQPSCYAEAALRWRRSLWDEQAAKTPYRGPVQRSTGRQRGRGY